MLKKYFKSELPKPEIKGDEDALLIAKSAEVIQAVDQLYGELAYSKILAKIWEFLDAGNIYINDTAPWNLTKTDDGKKRLATVLYNAAEACRVIAILIAPFMPETADKMMEQLGIDTPLDKQGMDSIQKWGWIKPGTQTHQGAQIFPRIEDKATAKILESVNIGGNVETKADQKPEDNGQITIDDFMKVDLRTAKILAAEKVKKSKKLIQLKVDLGTEQRQVLAGIAEAYEPEQLVGRTVILVANLKPAKLMGLESQGMILAGSDGDTIILGGFDSDLPPGVRVK
jgi:methionyl-tRNA synthetase